jgi:hypothetical protein
MLSAAFEKSVNALELFNAWTGGDRRERRSRITNLLSEEGIDPRSMFTASPGSSQYGVAKIVSARLTKGRLKLDLHNSTGLYEATVWVDIDSKVVVKAQMRKSLKAKP